MGSSGNEIWNVLVRHFDEEKVTKVVEALEDECIYRLDDIKDFTLAELRDLNVPAGMAKMLLLEGRKEAAFTLRGSRVAYLGSEAYDRVMSRCPSDMANQMITFTIQEQMSDTKPPALLNYRPDTARGLPIALVSPVFAYFLDLCDSLELTPTAKDSAFVNELCLKSSMAYVDEAKRCKMLFALLRAYLPLEFLVDEVGKKDIAILYQRQLLAICQVKNEEGFSGNAYLEAGAYYVRDLSDNRDEVMVRCERYPVFLLEITGALLKVSGAAFASCPLVEPLKMGLLVRRTNHKEMDALCRMVVALRKSLLKLVSLRAAVMRRPAAELDLAAVDLPYPLQEFYSTGGGVMVLSFGKLYVLDLQHSRDVLPTPFEQIKRSGVTKILAKFCQRYGSQVHADWFSRGCTPKLFNTMRLSGDWLMVLMEYMEGYTDLQRKTNVFPVSSAKWNKISSLARKCLKDAQASTLRGVHGDLRLDNLLVDEGLTHVLAVDFERAGIEGCDRYPFFMNHTDVEWPAGASDNQLLMQVHDNELLESQLERKHKRKYDWHNDRSFVPKKLAALASGASVSDTEEDF
ncbi:uncharacterized protein LOC9651044 [Selaginella moellendorffii]|uniref:uncharacterized protein LOC9651044 n=1 Tax=Selaginella moellendorffii TaxID=88036 RepID=UPI000D1CEC50|nr:uncharacterized protein LOC9651044 [Selaginella moellendorffii]|eukprot:XP_024533199.1 uncharacterized protein LOC9651044 [Selaginella moellendorffii]